MTAQEQTSTPRTWQEVVALHLAQRLVQWVRQDRHTPLVETLLTHLQGMMPLLPFGANGARRQKAAATSVPRQRPGDSMQPQPPTLAMEANTPEPPPPSAIREIPAALPAPRPPEVLSIAPPPAGNLAAPGGSRFGHEPVWMASPTSHTGPPPPPRPVVLIHHQMERFPGNRSPAAILQQRLGSGGRGMSQEILEPPH